ncbi:MAG: hypothetical protein A2145_00895 [candidate division Zixibacteria bacterium RBG_16_40_9]|nr:MAG: hypothetical protein A2145_00895 [candidate division Zixibacteria bacterium RBG_16_40_9]
MKKIFILVFAVGVVFGYSCKKTPDDVVLIKNLLTEFQQALIDKNPSQLDSLFAVKKELLQKDPSEITAKIFSQDTQNLVIADKRFEIHDSQAKVLFTLQGVGFEQKMNLYLVKYKNHWWIVNYEWQ